MRPKEEGRRRKRQPRLTLGGSPCSGEGRATAKAGPSELTFELRVGRLVMAVMGDGMHVGYNLANGVVWFSGRCCHSRLVIPWALTWATELARPMARRELVFAPAAIMTSARLG